MEMIRLFNILLVICTVVSCSNSPEKETGEINTINLLRDALFKTSPNQTYFDTRAIVTRKFIDNAKIPILFIELPTGQNGTLTQYPGNGDGETWLGADGATVTFKNGMLKASRGMGYDVMGSRSDYPTWNELEVDKTYKRKFSFLDGNNKLKVQIFECKIYLLQDKIKIDIFGVNFMTRHFVEKCKVNNFEYINDYYVDSKQIVRRSRQYHSSRIGHIFTERLER